MRIQVQIMRHCLYPTHNLHPAIPSIVAKTPRRIYMFNTPQLHRRLLSYHNCRIQRPLSIFFTNNSIAAFGGLFTFLLELFQRKRTLQTFLYFDTKLYNYFIRNWTRLGRRILQLSYVDLLTSKAKLGFKKPEQFSAYCRNPEYWNFRGNLPNSQFNKYASETKNASNFIKIDDKGRRYYQDEEMEIRYFSIEEANGSCSYSYIFIPEKINPRLDKQIIEKHALKPDSVKILLETGSLKVSDDGQTVIKLEDVIIQESIQPNFMILSYRNLEQLRELFSKQILQQYIQNDTEELTNSVIHIISGPLEFIKNQEFCNLLSKLGKNVKHIIHHPQAEDSQQKCDKFFKHFDLSAQIHKSVPQNMPDLKEIFYQFLQKNPSTRIDTLYPNLWMRAARNLYELKLSPLRQQGYHPIIENKPPKLPFVPLQLPSFQEQKKTQRLQEFDPRIIFLGTSSMISTALRNISGILLEISYNDLFLFDCGDGIFNQILNHYGQQEIQNVLKSLKVIFITHLHADHCTGILKLIQQRNKLAEKTKIEKLFLIIPSNMIEWVDQYSRFMSSLDEHCQILFTEALGGMQLSQILKMNENTPKKIKTIFKSVNKCPNSKESQNKLQTGKKYDQEVQDYYPSHQFKSILLRYEQRQQEIIKKFKEYLHSINLKSFTPVPVYHCPQSYGVVLQHNNKTKISYSGDCRPTEKFIQMAQNSSLLIHEATFLDHEMNSAKTYRHTTVGEAIDIGIKSKSEMTALTHFSVRRTSSKSHKIIDPNRYSSIPPKRHYADKNTFECFDHLTFKLSQLHKMPKITRFMKSLMRNEEQNDEKQ